MNFFLIIFTITMLLSGFILPNIFAQQNDEIKQVVLKDELKSFTDYGKYTDAAYREFYNPFSAFDNIKNSTYSFWSQYGEAGFDVQLKNPIADPVCSAEIEVFNPKNSPFTLTVGDKTASGVLDSTKKQVLIGGNECAINASSILFNVDADKQWTTISEITLFTQKKTPPVEPPICPPDSYWDAKLQKCVAISNPINGTTIVNSTITLNVSGSTITVNADETSKVTTNKEVAPNEVPKPKLTAEEVNADDKKKEKEKEDEDK